MAKNKITYEIIEGYPDNSVYTALETLYVDIFEDADLHFFKKRFQEKSEIVTVVALKESEIVGFKIGYHYNYSTFYSWVGGVKLAFRNQGIALRLSQLQEERVRQKGYTKLRTKSMNRFKPMMILNLKNGFDITQIYTNDFGQTKIVFEKNL